MTLITLGLACPHLGRQPGACTGTHRWLAVIALARWLEPPLPTLALLAPAALFLWRREPGPRLAAACALALLAGGVRTLWATPHFGPDDLATDNDHGQVTLVGVVVDEPDVRDTYQNLRLRVESLTMESSPDMRPVRGLVLVQAPRYPIYAYGERLAVSGELETPQVFEDFSYKDYLARQGVCSMLRRPRIELIEAGQGNPLWAALYAFKARGRGTIAQILPEPYAALLTGILLGVETGIPQNLYEQFNATGTSHIIVISGFNSMAVM